MNRIDNGKRRKPSRVMRRLKAANGSDSDRMMRTIPRSPSALVHRLRATKGKADQKMLTAQNKKNNRIRRFFRNSGATLSPLATSTATAASNRKANTFRSMGLPSSKNWDGSATFKFSGAIPSHKERGRELIRNSHAVGIQSA